MCQENVNKLEDSVLLSQIAERERKAFDMLYDRYFNYVYTSAYKRLNNADQAADIAQEVFVQLWTRKSVKPIENLPAYLFTMVRHNVFKLLEREQRYEPLPDLFDQGDGSTANADAFLLHQEFLKAFQQLVDSLSPQQRVIFRLRYEEDLSAAEIAEKLNLSPKTVRNQLGRALNRMKGSLAVMLVVFFSCH